MSNNILQVVQHLKPGGIETMTLDLQQHLENCTVHIVSLEGEESETLENWPRLQERKEQLHFLNKKQGFQISTVFKLALLIKKLKITAVHTHHIGPLTYGGLAARMCGIKHLVHTEHDAWHLENDKAAKLQTRLLRFLKPELVADCNLVARQLQKLQNYVAPYVIYNGIDTNRFKPANPDEKIVARKSFGLPQGVRLIGCAARLEKVKGVSYLIAAMSYLPEDIHLVIAGDGQYMRRLKRQANFNRSGARITFLGRIENMHEFYKALDVFCLPSLNEGFPLSPLEAQSCNVPVIITNVGGSKEALCPHTGALVPPSDANALRKSIEETIFQIKSASPRTFVETKANLKLMTAAYSKLLSL